MADSLSKWREYHERDGLLMASIEAEARAAGFGEPFVIHTSYVSWNEYGSDHKNGKSLERFKEMIAVVAALVGPPDEITAPAYDFQDTPDLCARWDRPFTLDLSRANTQWDIYVRITSPRGCKIDPRTPRVKGQAPALHPECKAVLDALTDQL